MGLPSMSSRSLPTQERGLKPVVERLAGYAKLVAPHTGAWIETSISRHLHALIVSLPTQERGLKLALGIFALGASGSLPTQERGLKQLVFPATRPAITPSLPTQERGLKLRTARRSTSITSRSPHRSVD